MSKDNSSKLDTTGFTSDPFVKGIPENGFDVGVGIGSNAPPSKDTNLEIIVEDDTPEKDKGRPRRAPDKEPYDVQDDEIEKYDESVKKRIKKLRFEYHEERRLKEESARREMAALDHARRLVAENARLTGMLQQGEKTLIETAKAKAAANMEAAKRALAEAHAAGDAEKIASATADLSRQAAEIESYSNYQPTMRGEVKSPEDSVREFDTHVAKVRGQNANTVHEKALNWYGRNKDWFGSDAVMTSYAKQVEQALLSRGSSIADDRHYEMIDKEMRRVFPGIFANRQEPDSEVETGADDDDEFDNELVIEKSSSKKTQNSQGQARTPSYATQKVAPVARGNSSVGNAARNPGRPKQVRLTQSEAIIARKLGLTLEQYAEQKMRDYPNE